MNKIIRFTPLAEVNALQNLQAFVSLCRTELHALGPDLLFDTDAWDVTGWQKAKGVSDTIRINFSNWETASARARWTPMKEPYRSFAKAYVRYQHAWRPLVSYSTRLTALRALERALEETTGGHCPTHISSVVLNRATQLLVEALAPTTAYSAGKELELLAKFASEHRLFAVPVYWKSSVSAPDSKRNHVGKEFDKERKEKMPSPAAFYALAEIFRSATEPADVLVSAVSALLCSAPSRIVEVVLLPSACEVIQSDSSTGMDMLGIRWRPAKGGKPMVKWIATSMRDVAVEALQKLRDLSEPARRIAQWYEANPGRLYLPPELEYLRGNADLTMPEVSSIFFEDEHDYNPARPHQWCKGNNVATVRRGREAFASFADVESAVIRRLPPTFPLLDVESGLRYSEALIILRKNELDPGKSTCRMVDPVDPSDIASRLGRRLELSIFEKFGQKEEDGSPIVVRTHQFRHYLNTLAQAGNLGQLDLAKWSGRANVHQNSAYDHVSDRDVTAKLRLAISGQAAAVGPIARLHEVALIPRDEFARLRVATAHTTEFGYCVHDFSMLPCQSFQDCINCNEHTCIKGDEIREQNIRRSRKETCLLLERARDAASEGEYGADRWLAHQTLTLQRLTSLCRILDDPNVPKGAVIRLADASVGSRIDQAEQARAFNVAVGLRGLSAPGTGSVT